MKKNYHIIYLNGSSSAGKSTLARALQNKLDHPFMVVGIDQIIFMMPDKLNDWYGESLVPGFSWKPITDEQGNVTAQALHVGSFGKKMKKALIDIVVALAKSGLCVIVDDVSFGKNDIDEWKEALKDFKVLWVGVTAPLEVLEQREKERGRKIGSAKWQAERVHVGVCYDLMIDSSTRSVDGSVAIIQNEIGE